MVGLGRVALEQAVLDRGRWEVGDCIPLVLLRRHTCGRVQAQRGDEDSECKEASEGARRPAEKNGATRSHAGLA